MSDREERRLASRLRRIEQTMDALARSRQLSASTVQLRDIDGVAYEVPLPDAVGQGVQAGEIAEAAYSVADAAAATALLAKTTADGRNRVFAAGVKPVAPADAPFVAGDLWYATDMLGRFVNVSVWSSVANDFVEHQMVASSVLVPGTVGNVLIANGAIDGKTITGALLRTAASGQRMEFDVNGLQAFRSDGTQMAALRPDTGGMRVDGTFIAGVAGTTAGYRSYLSNSQLAIMDAGASGAIAGNPSSTVTPGNLRLAVGATGGNPARAANYQAAEASLFEGVAGSGPFRSNRVGLDGVQVTSAAGPGGLGQADAFLGTQQVSGVRSSYASVDQVKTDKITSRSGPVIVEAGASGDVTLQAGAFKKIRMLSPVENYGDTDWVYPTLSGGTNVSGNPFGYRRLAGVVWLTGRVNVGDGVTVFTMPPGFQMAGGDDNVRLLDRGGPCRVNFKSTGAIEVISGGAGGVSFAGTSYLPS